MGLIQKGRGILGDMFKFLGIQVCESSKPSWWVYDANGDLVPDLELVNEDWKTHYDDTQAITALNPIFIYESGINQLHGEIHEVAMHVLLNYVPNKKKTISWGKAHVQEFGRGVSYRCRMAAR